MSTKSGGDFDEAPYKAELTAASLRTNVAGGAYWGLAGQSELGFWRSQLQRSSLACPGLPRLKNSAFRWRASVVQGATEVVTVFRSCVGLAGEGPTRTVVTIQGLLEICSLLPGSLLWARLKRCP